MKNVVKIAILSIFIGLTSCQKFDDGGLVTKADARIINSWELQSYWVDGVESTSSLLISNLQETYK